MRWREQVLALGAGVVFAIGLALAGMTQPDKVVGFLDVGGDWDPALGFVMGGAVLVHGLAYVVRGRMRAPVWGDAWRIPEAPPLDGRLIGGAALFGVGWAIGGYCPGPLLVAMPTLAPDALWFGGGMVGGMWLFHAWQARRPEAAPVSDVCG